LDERAVAAALMFGHQKSGNVPMLRRSEAFGVLSFRRSIFTVAKPKTAA
jgi:hypothetical protein